MSATRGQEYSQNPGFSVTKTTDDDQNKDNEAGDIVIFDDTITNEDDAYDKDTGKATIKTSGMYFVHFSITSIRKEGTEGDALFTLVRKNVGSTIENSLVRCENDPRENNQEMSCTNGIFLWLNEGDELWIKIDPVGCGHKCLLKGNKQCSFTAFRI